MDDINSNSDCTAVQLVIFSPANMKIGIVMRRLVPWAFVLFVFAQFGGWVSVSEAAAKPQSRSKAAAEAQSKQQGARLARLYFLREKGLLATEAGIKIDGQSVGSVSKGFYFSVDRPPGRYRITCVNTLSADYEVEVQIEGGQTYYFGIGTVQTAAPGQNLLNQAVSGSSGRQLPSASLMSGLAGTAIYQIDAAEGPAVISQLKPE
jgi:Protein of unknown function (DUF2846)